MNLRARYDEALKNMLPPGCGCHTYLLTVANYGVLAGLSADQIFSDIRRSIPHGSRKIPDKEIQDAIRKALGDHSSRAGWTPRPKPAPIVKDITSALQNIINTGKISSEDDLKTASPIKLIGEPAADATLFLTTLYDDNDYIFAGGPYDTGNSTTIHPVCEWINLFQSGKDLPEFFIVNPLSGMPAEKKSGGTTYRGDRCVKSFRYCLAEFDNLSREDQIRFWSSAKLPIRALIDSGNKSIHAIIDVQKLATVVSLDQWQTEIKSRLYDQILTPLGCDGACSNAARLSRLPGHYRTGKGAYQRLLWLSAEGKSIC